MDWSESMPLVTSKNKSEPLGCDGKAFKSLPHTILKEVDQIALFSAPKSGAWS
jgi:hypothetical protein